MNSLLRTLRRLCQCHMTMSRPLAMSLRPRGRVFQLVYSHWSSSEPGERTATGYVRI